MIVIRRLVDRRRAYTGIFLKGEAPRIFPTSDHEHARILSIFKQDRAYQDVQNDFADYALGQAVLSATTALPGSVETNTAPPILLADEIEPVAKGPRRDEDDSSRWLALWADEP